MMNTKPRNASEPASAVYELSGRRYVVSVVYCDNIGAPLSELLLRIMVNDDGKTASDTRDRNRSAVVE